MFRKSNINETVYFFLVSLKYRQIITVKGELSGLRQLLATESHVKMMKNASYFTFKALFVQDI